MTEISIQENNTQEEIKEVNPKKHKFWEILIVVLLTIATIIGVIYWEICNAPFNKSWLFGDTEVNINANYNSKYNVIKLDLIADEVVEKWQVSATGGKVEGIKIECETSDKSVKREFKFEDISLKEGEKISTSLSIDNAKLKDFLMVKDLLSGTVVIFAQPVISFDIEEREKMKKYHTSGASLFGDFFLYYMMGGR